MDTWILGIESSCDDTAAAVLCNQELKSNVIASQAVHAQYGGVVPELASRAHQQNIVPVVDAALKQAGIRPEQLHAVAFTRGPGLLGSLLVGTSFAKAFAYSLDLPLIEVDHLQGHILSHFIHREGAEEPRFPFLCLLVSGGHTQIVRMNSHFDREIVGTTIDDAAGEAFDKAAKILGFPYPGGPQIDRLARMGNPSVFHFSEAHIPAYDYSFSGLKTSFLYLVRDRLRENPHFIEENAADLCASFQFAVCSTLMKKLVKAAKDLRIREVAIAGGVSANSGLQQALREAADKYHWTIHIPTLSFSTDNAAMIAIAGYYKYAMGTFSGIHAVPYTRSEK
ncbi:MAG: tRNA (adenosine(37)-N6)-threonylcarbamoyltransferase complex transferase subunit TsaD [Bacteroidales bacterium]|nr:tRNA (adenosine(37)-N6)-threonylcarbamoyltransferase complex transferase subunit TsaD [Bacteroidales bacterium]